MGSDFDPSKVVVYNYMLHEFMTTKLEESIDGVLGAIIDDWYKTVSRHYVTEEDVAEGLEEDTAAQLKRFHDEKGHRIKFAKYELDITYGLKATWNDQQIDIEISVNNKVDHFDYEDFRKQLLAHYDDAGSLTVTKPADLGRPRYRDVFQLKSGLDEAFQVERNKGRADIMRLTFQIPEEYTGRLTVRPGATRELIERYCVAPFRSVYARVYRNATS